MSDENITPPATTDYNFTPKFSYLHTKTRVEFNGSCLKKDKIMYTHRIKVNTYLVYEINKNFSITIYPTPENSLFGAVSLTKNIDKFKYPGYGIGFDRNCIIFGVDMSFSAHVEYRKKYILFPGEGTRQGLDGITLTAEKGIQLILMKIIKKYV